jgi:regulator of nucleoside diphosphate kinase
MSQRNILITDIDRRRLGTLVEQAMNLRLVDRRCIADLEHELERATAVDPGEVPGDVVTMNSTVRLRDLDTGEEETYTLVYPTEANINENRISVLAPVGTAIIGYRVGDVIKWPVPGGLVRLRVEEILYHPEQAGEWRRKGHPLPAAR